MVLQQFNLFCEINGNWISEWITCSILQEEVKLVWEKSAQKLRKYQERYIWIMLGYPQSRRRTNRSHRDWPVNPRSVDRLCPSRPIHVHGTPTSHTVQHCTCIVIHTQHSTPRCVRYSDKLPMKITCNCWNNSLWNHLPARPGKQMSLESPGIISLQIQVTTKDFESWIHYWTIPL